MATKREAAGYISLTPKKKCADGRNTKFGITLQDSPTSNITLQGFNDETHQQLKEFAESKSPVKMVLFKNPGYKERSSQ